MNKFNITALLGLALLSSSLWAITPTPAQINYMQSYLVPIKRPSVLK